MPNGNQEGNVLFNNALNTFYLQLNTVVHIIMDHKEYYHSLFSITSKGSYRQDSTYHDLCYTSCEALAGMINSSMAPPGGIDPTPVTAEAETLTLCSAL